MNKSFAKKFSALTAGVIALSLGALGAAACTASYQDTTDTLFFYPLNYYGLKGRGFTARWDGMKAALSDYGWNVTGDGQKDSLKFKVTRDPACTMPDDTKIVMVNNQTWDTGIALTEPLAEYKPLAVISTCNGVEFCSTQIESWSPATQNATMAGFSPSYENAYKKGTLSYLASKYSASVAPVVALVYNAVVTGKRIETPQGKAVNLSQDYWQITSYDEYKEASVYDNYGGGEDNPTIMKADMDYALPATNPSATYDDFVEMVKKTATYEGVKELYEGNRNKTDTIATTQKIKVALIVPGSINDSVQSYIDYMKKYAAKVYNMSFENYSVTGSTTQKAATENACNAGVDAIISLQDDTDRVASIQYANSKGVFFATAGCTMGEIEYETEESSGTVTHDSEYSQVEDLPYYAGAVGASLDADSAAAYQMTAYYLQMICDRSGQGGKIRG